MAKGHGFCLETGCQGGKRQAGHTRNLWLSCLYNGDKSEFGDELFKIYFILLVSLFLIFVKGTIDSNFCVLLHMGIHDICRRHCLWSKNIMLGKIAPHEKITNYSTFVMWSNLSLLHMINLQCMLSCRNLRCFDAMSILSHFTHICGAKINPQILSVEQKWKMSCEHMGNFYRYEVQGVFFSHLYPPKKLEYGKPRLGESTWT